MTQLAPLFEGAARDTTEEPARAAARSCRWRALQQASSHRCFDCHRQQKANSGRLCRCATVIWRAVSTC